MQKSSIGTHSLKQRNCWRQKDITRVTWWVWISKVRVCMPFWKMWCSWSISTVNASTPSSSTSSTQMNLENTIKTYSMRENWILLSPKKSQFRIQLRETLWLTLSTLLPAIFLITQQVISYAFSFAIFVVGSEAHESACWGFSGAAGFFLDKRKREGRPEERRFGWS